MTVWLEGYPTISFEVEIKRNELELLPVYNPKHGIDSKVTVIIKTFRRYSCLTALVSSIRSYYPTLSIIIADDRNVLSCSSLIYLNIR